MRLAALIVLTSLCLSGPAMAQQIYPSRDRAPSTTDQAQARGALPSTKPSACPNIFTDWFESVPKGMVLNAAGDCVPASCPAGSSYDPSTNSCVLPRNPNCPAGTAWDGSNCRPLSANSGNASGQPPRAFCDSNHTGKMYERLDMRVFIMCP